MACFKYKILFAFFLLIIVAGLSNALVFNGQTCSTTASDYQYYNSTGGSYTGAVIIDIDDITQASNQVFAIFEENVYFANDGDGQCELNTRDGEANYLMQFKADAIGGTNWGYYDAGWHDVGILSTNAVYYNITRINDFANDVWNLTINSSSINGFMGDNTFRNNENFSDIYYSSDNGASQTGIYIWNCTDNACNCPTAAPPVPPSSNSINFSSPQPANDSIFNATLLGMNVTVNNTNQMNCSLYINDTFNQSKDNYSAGTNTFLDFNVSFSIADELTINFTFGCYDGVNDTNSSTNTIFIDNVYPSATWTWPATNNQSTVNNKKIDSANFSILLEDPNIYSYYLNITWPNDTVIQSYSATGLSGTSYTVNDSFGPLNASGYYKAKLKFCDGHTDNEIDIVPKVGKDELQFDSIRIYQQVKSDTSALSYNKLSDRYSFSIRQKTISDTMSIIVESPSYIDILHGKTKFPGHLITSNYWIDFSNPYIASIEVYRITDYKVKVVITADRLLSNWQFNSVGEINCLEEEVQFYGFNYSIVYDGWKTNSSDNFSRQLTLNYSYDCPSFITAANRLYIDGSIWNTSTTALTCDGNTNTLQEIFTYSSESEYNISNLMNFSSVIEDSISNQTFISDLYSPTVENFQVAIDSGFNITTGNVTLNCSDGAMSYLTYNITYGYQLINLSNYTNGTSITDVFILNMSEETYYGGCSDLFGYVWNNITPTLYFRQLILIDEKENIPFEVRNITSARVYIDDNSTYFDFKTENVSQINFTSMESSQLRFELGYPGDVIITRYVDVSLNDGDLRVCANKDGVTHYEQLLVSSSETAATLKNVFSDCVVAEDYTRFAYQDALILRAFTIDSFYKLYTYNTTTPILLAGLDGGKSTYYNLDILEFNSQGYNLNFQDHTLTFEKTADTVVQLYYINNKNDSIMTNLTIKESNSSTVFLTHSETSNPNEFYLLFDYSTLGLPNSTILRIDLTTQNSNGETKSLTRYFNLSASRGIFTSSLAFVIGLLLTIFGLTFTTTRITFGWFGGVVLLASISVMALSTMTWYITLLMVVDMIILVYIFLISFMGQTQVGVT